jgi:uncharacterized peroxidase-related enzyme
MKPRRSTWVAGIRLSNSAAHRFFPSGVAYSIGFSLSVGGSLKYPDPPPPFQRGHHEHAADQPLPRTQLEDLPDDIRARILEVQEKSGFVPNVFLALAHRPAEWRAFFAYHDALMEKDSGLTKAEREMIVVATSERQRLPVLRGRPRRHPAHPRQEPLVADQVAINHRKADITPRQKAMLDFAMKVALDSGAIGDADFARCTATASTTRTSGTSAPSRPSSASATAWPT